jgi:hypothetical protein
MRLLFADVRFFANHLQRVTYYDAGDGLGMTLRRDGVCTQPLLSLP